MPKITRPAPLPDPPVSTIGRIALQLGLTVVAGDHYDQSGLLAPGTYGQAEASQFLREILDLGSNEAIDAWIEANPIYACTDRVGWCDYCGLAHTA